MSKKEKLPTRKAVGFRLKCDFTDGTTGFTNIEAKSAESLMANVKALGGKGRNGIKKVISIKPHTWDQEYYEFNLNFF